MRNRNGPVARTRQRSWDSIHVGMAFLFVVFVAGLLASVGIALTVQSPEARFDLITIPVDVTLPTSSTPSGGTTTGFITTTTVPATITTSSIGVTTTPTIPINITCPPPTTVSLGFNFEPAFTGGFALAGGGCTVPAVSWTDTTLGFISKRNIPVPESEHIPKWSNNPDIARLIEGQVGSVSVLPQILSNMEPDSYGMLDAHGGAESVELVSRGNFELQNPPPKKRELPPKKAKLRSASFNSTNVIVLGTPLQVSNTGAVPPDSTAAVSSNHIVMGVNSASGSLITVTDKSTTFISSFTLSSLGMGNCSGATRGDPQIMFDHEAQRWVFLELGVAGTNALCVYLSDTNDPLSTYMSFQYDFDPYFPDFPKIGLWRRAYLLTFNMDPLGPSDTPENLCVIDREDMLNFIPNVNKTAPNLLCAASLLGRLSGFPGFQAWTPVSAEGGPMPPQATEAANAPGVGAVFMRHVDDELHESGGTPLVDFIEIEHWSNINWTLGTFSAQRYRVNIADFDSSFSGCIASNICIPTPTAQELDPVREVINQRLSYRFIPETGQESLVGTFTSHANGVAVAQVRWFELRWTTPNVAIPKSWRLFQEGAVPFNDGIHRWMSSINMDGNGTIALSYSESNALVYPSLMVTTRLANDPPGQVRTPITLAAGDVGSVIPGNRWGDYASVSIDPDSSRFFYVTGQKSSNTFPWVVSLTHLRVLGETVQRFWRAEDECGTVSTCTQIITAV